MAMVVSGSEQPVVLCWFKTTDLRLDDHAALVAAHRLAVERRCTVVHLLALDPLWWAGAESVSGGAHLPRVGLRRARFMHESVSALQLALQERGQELVIFQGSADAALRRLAAPAGKLRILAVHAHADMCIEEVDAEARVRASLASLPGSSAQLELHWGWTLHHLDDLPAAMQRGHAVPERYKPFLQAVQRGKRSASARRPVGEPTVWAGASSCLPRNWTLPPVEALLAPGVFEADSLCAKGSADADEAGGEQAALQAMRRYIWEQDRLKSYVGSSDSMSPGKCNALNSTTRLSTYLAHGCLSPRRLYAEVLSYEKRRVRNRSTYWVFHEMVFRDFFAFSCIKWGARMFSAGGPLRSPAAKQWRSAADPETQRLFARWQEGRTGYPFVDAGMRQLKAEGRMPHLLRQICAGFLVRDLRIDWRWGAEWFERTLADYTPDANWGNWGYRILPVRQIMPLCETHLTSLEILSWPWVHDPHLEYILTWLPELRSIAEASNQDRRNVLEPWRLAKGYRRKGEIDVTPARDSPLWIMSVNRNSWPEYQQMMTGRAFTLSFQPHSPDCLHAERCHYPPPLVAPVELEILAEKIPVDHSWGVRQSPSVTAAAGQRKKPPAARTPTQGEEAKAARGRVASANRGAASGTGSRGSHTPREPPLAAAASSAATAARSEPLHTASSPQPQHGARTPRQDSARRVRKAKPRRRGGGRVQSGPLSEGEAASATAGRTYR